MRCLGEALAGKGLTKKLRLYKDTALRSVLYFFSHLFFAFLISNITYFFIALVVILKYIECHGQSSLASVRRYNKKNKVKTFIKIIPFSNSEIVCLQTKKQQSLVYWLSCSHLS